MWYDMLVGSFSTYPNQSQHGHRVAIRSNLDDIRAAEARRDVIIRPDQIGPAAMSIIEACASPAATIHGAIVHPRSPAGGGLRAHDGFRGEARDG